MRMGFRSKLQDMPWIVTRLIDSLIEVEADNW